MKFRTAALLCTALVLFTGALLLTTQPAAPARQLSARWVPTVSPVEPIGACYREEESRCTQTTERECFEGANNDDLVAWRLGEECPQPNTCNLHAGRTLVFGGVDKYECNETSEVWFTLEQQCAQDLAQEVQNACRPAAKCRATPLLDGPIFEYSTREYYPYYGGTPAPTPLTACGVSCKALIVCIPR